jgi:hypothetical protein
MVLSGGYQQENAPIIASSIQNILSNIIKLNYDSSIGPDSGSKTFQ